jgi:large subunit ribosomal protein L21
MRGKITALVAAVAAAVGAAGAAKWARDRKDEDELELEVGGTTASPSTPQGKPATPETAPAPAPATAAASQGGDDLTAIKGLGKVKAQKLVEAGVTSYAQIAAWSDEDIAEIGLKVNTSPGQIKREDWVGQAKALGEG